MTTSAVALAPIGLARAHTSLPATSNVFQIRQPSEQSLAAAATTAAASLLQPEFEQAVAICLHLWPALSAAVTNGWGGPESADKRAWLAGAVVDLFPPLGSRTPEPDVSDLELLLQQALLDEFALDLDDDSAVAVAAHICALRADCTAGRRDALHLLRRFWDARCGTSAVIPRRRGADESDSDSDSEDSDDDDAHTDAPPSNCDMLAPDVEMDDGSDAPALVSVKRERPRPQIDDDGFTVVTRRKG